MHEFVILYDEPHEAEWFKSLNIAFRDAREEPIDGTRTWMTGRNVLAYDRPDIILLDGADPILVVEETVEVPSGHNVGQRFARIAAAAECNVPCLYFGPYVAKKHGGETAGPRYMNVRLFHAMDAMERVTGSAVTTINWPVDEHCEVRRDGDKDADVKEYVATFLELYRTEGMAGINKALLESAIHRRMIDERNHFVRTGIRRPEQYDGPPDSVEHLQLQDFLRRYRVPKMSAPKDVDEVVVYNVGMKNIRSDPYTGMGILYKYLYIEEHPNRMLILYFPNISIATWQAAAARANRKDIRLFRVAADAILFSDGLKVRGDF